MKRILLIFLIMISPSFCDQGEELYENGCLAQNTIEKSIALNHALQYYLKQANAKYDNAIVHYNLGNCYFQLQQYSLASFHYYQALAYQPRLKKAQDNLKITLKKLGLTELYDDPVNKFIFKYYFPSSYYERVLISNLLTILLTVSISLYLWYKKKYFKNISKIIFLILLLFISSIIYDNYSNSTYAIIITSTTPHSKVGDNFEESSKYMLLAGSKVKVNSVKGDWVKVSYKYKDIGFIKLDQLKLIRR